MYHGPNGGVSGTEAARMFPASHGQRLPYGKPPYALRISDLLSKVLVATPAHGHVATARYPHACHNPRTCHR